MDHFPHKVEENQTRLRVGENLVEHPGDVSTPTVGTTTARLVINSTISTLNACYMYTDVKHFYLNMPMDQHKYMQLAIALFPQEIIDKYNLQDIKRNGYIYIEI